MMFGIYNRDGRPVDDRLLSAMARAGAAAVCDEPSLWTAGAVGFAGRGPCAIAREVGPGLAMAAQARLDDRAELARRLGLPATPRPSDTDTGLLLAAYRHWDTGCPDQLLGDWSMVVWDARLQRLFLARDHFGPTALYYFESARTFVFGSSVAGLLAHPDVPRRLHLAAFLDSGYRQDARTAYEGIVRVTPAQAMTIDAQRRRGWQYWNPRDAAAVRCRSDRDYLAAYEDVLTRSVQDRLPDEGAVGLTLSGGLDSGAIAAIAGPRLAARGQRLHAFTSVPRYGIDDAAPPDRSGDEGAEAAAVCRQVGAIGPHYLRGERGSLLQAIDRALDLHGLPFANANTVWLLEAMQAARAAGIGVMLDGWGGNFGMSWPGDRAAQLRDVLRQRRWGDWLAEVRAYRRDRARGLGVALVAHALLPLVPADLATRLDRWRRPRGLWLTASARRLAAVQRRESGVEVAAAAGMNPALQHYLRNGHAALLQELAGGAGLQVRLPALDRRVIDFCMGLPMEQHRRQGEERRLVRRAMADRLPACVVAGRRRGLQSADIVPRLRAEAEEIGVALRELARSPGVCEYIDVARLQRHFERLCSVPQSPALLEPSNRFLRGLATARFIGKQDHG